MYKKEGLLYGSARTLVSDLKEGDDDRILESRTQFLRNWRLLGVNASIPDQRRYVNIANAVMAYKTTLGDIPLSKIAKADKKVMGVLNENFEALEDKSK